MPITRSSAGRLRAPALIIALACSPAVLAQVVLPPGADPGQIQERQRELEKRLREGDRRPADEQRIDRDAIKPKAQKRSTLTNRFVLQRIEFGESAILSPDELKSAARDLEGREVTLGEVQDLVDRVNALYKARNVFTAQAVLPAQDVSSGVVKIRLVEGKVGRVILEGNASTREAYITEALSQKPGMLADVTTLEQDMARFNRSNDVQLRAELKAGEKFGETDILMTVNEPPKHEMRVFADSSGSEATGAYRVGVFYQNRSLLGFRDALGVTVTRADGHEGKALTYAFPVSNRGTRMVVSYFNDDTEIKHGPFKHLDITGESTAYTAQIKHPLVVGAQHQLDVNVGAKKRKTESWIDGQLFQDTDTDDRSIGLEGQLWESDRIWSASITYSNGKSDSRNDTVAQKFDIWRGTLKRVQEFGHDGWAVHVMLNAQYSRDKLLPSSEQFLIGGEGTVRGYQTGLFSGDKGYVATAELHHPIFASEQSLFRSTGFFFLDHGETRPYRAVGAERGADKIAGWGWGVNMSYSDKVSARITLGIGARDRNEEDRGSYVNFQIVSSVF